MKQRRRLVEIDFDARLQHFFVIRPLRMSHQILIDDFNTGIDIHAKTASDVYGVPLGEVTKTQRRDAKVINFGVLYGMSPHGLAAATGMTFTAAKQFIDHYFELRRPIRQFIDATLAQARSDGYVETYFGRRRPTPDIHSSNFIVRQAAERAAANMPIQGTEADLMKRAMLQVQAELGGMPATHYFPAFRSSPPPADRLSLVDVSKDTPPHKKQSISLPEDDRKHRKTARGWHMADQLLQIHDSILVECAPANADTVAARMKEIMEAVAPELPIMLKVDVSTGRDWGKL